MAGERHLDKLDSQFSGFRKLPEAEELSEEDSWGVLVYGARQWLATADKDWDDIADQAAAMFLAGYDQQDIARLLRISDKDLKQHVDLEAVQALMGGEISKRIYETAAGGNVAMMKLVATHRLGWTERKEVKHSGTVSVQPVLNINLLGSDGIVEPVVPVAQELPQEQTFIDVLPQVAAEIIDAVDTFDDDFDDEEALKI